MPVPSQLPDAEFEIMQIIWSQSAPITSARVDELISEIKAWHVSTVKTLTAVIQSAWMIIMCLSCAVMLLLSLRKKEISAVIIYITSFATLSFAAFLLIEAQKRYSYPMITMLFIMAAILLSVKSKKILE